MLFVNNGNGAQFNLKTEKQDCFHSPDGQVCSNDFWFNIVYDSEWGISHVALEIRVCGII